MVRLRAASVALLLSQRKRLSVALEMWPEMRTLPDKKAQLRRLLLSSAFSQAEADETLKWLETPAADSYHVGRALFRGLRRRQEVQEGRRAVSVADKIDSLSRRIAYRLDKLGIEA